MKRERNYSDVELNRKTAEVRQRILTWIKEDKEREAEAARREQIKMPSVPRR